MNDFLHPLLQQQISRYLPVDYQEKADINRFIEEVNKSCYSPLATPVPPQSSTNDESAFLSIINHEIRTPLNAIVGLLDMMQQEGPPPAWQDYCQQLRASVDSMELAFTNILDYRHIRIGQLNLNMAPLLPRQLLGNVLKTNQSKLKGFDVSLGLSIADTVPVVVQGDQARLSQIINNVLMIAGTIVRCGLITLRVDHQYTPTGDGFITFTFDLPCDDPVRQVMLQKAVLPAEKATQEPTDGLVLAMLVTKRLLGLYGSSIQVSRQSAQSMTLCFAIPTFDTARPTVPPVQPNEQSLLGMRVLMVEDYPINVRIASRFLERWQVAVDVAENGQIALDKYTAGQYDLILMDIQMPVLDGLQATRAIRLNDNQIPIVALTASATPTDQANAYAAGMNSFLTKPFNADDLFRTLLRYGRPVTA
ncbi:CheY-like chemotaxis protein [Spirosoma oryzae]|uniref:histidine kinase n=1 Tax=Spirosoma oryzae TaxID=1469603 RepID=A0A2T0SL51_9BACT|nr:response regulator [Spirosoma oryzae]PRY34139.1 CheY-like chemotaxis protein [Spirosoma oryzae]